MDNNQTTQSVAVGRVLLLIDWDNFFLSLISLFKTNEGIMIENRIKKLMKWIEENLGELLGGHGFVFAPEHLSSYHQRICARNGLKLVICPKRPMNPGEEDTVDETIIWFAEMMVNHPNFETICLVSGDSDYVPLFEEMGRQGIKRALAPPTVGSLSKSGDLVELVDINQETAERLLFMLDSE
jgi:hypothetical protein